MSTKTPPEQLQEASYVSPVVQGFSSSHATAIILSSTPGHWSKLSAMPSPSASPIAPNSLAAPGVTKIG